MKKLNNKKGFTIVELVLVIAVIGILDGVLIPTFSGIVQRANDSATTQEMTNALKVVLAGNATSGALANGTTFVMSSNKEAVSYSVYNGNKLGNVYSVKDDTNPLTVKETVESTEKSKFAQVIVQAKDDTYDADALLAIAKLYDATATIAPTVENDKITVGSFELKVLVNSDLSVGTFVLVP